MYIIGNWDRAGPSENQIFIMIFTNYIDKLRFKNLFLFLLYGLVHYKLRTWTCSSTRRLSSSSVHSILCLYKMQPLC